MAQTAVLPAGWPNFDEWPDVAAPPGAASSATLPADSYRGFSTAVGVIRQAGAHVSYGEVPPSDIVGRVRCSVKAHYPHAGDGRSVKMIKAKAEGECKFT